MPRGMPRRKKMGRAISLIPNELRKGGKRKGGMPKPNMPKRNIPKKRGMGKSEGIVPRSARWSHLVKKRR